VLLDVAVHELDYLLWLLGPATSVSALTGRGSSLEIDVDDFSLITLELRTGAVAELCVNYFDRSYHRGCRIVGERASAQWEWERERLTVGGANAGVAEHEVPSDVAAAYRRQLERFISAVNGSDQPFPTAGEARRVLAVIDGCRRSSRDGRRVKIAPDIGLREAVTGDRDRLLEWRNDPETRRWSRVEDQVSGDAHDRWLASMLSDPKATLWIAETDGTPIGQVRLTREGSDALELHTTLAPEFRGRGLSTAMLVEAAARALADSHVDRLIAHVKDGNTPSLRAFTGAGFHPTGRDHAGLIRLERRPCG
jgi:RimJ/RimL family protein N-acetyltransferase